VARERLRFPGRVDDAELAALYEQCEVFAFPSLHEGFGLPVLEAMSCGAAVVASNTTSIPEVIGRDDVLFDPTDSAAIAHKLDAVLRDEGFRTELRRYGLERARLFSWEAVAQRALDALIAASMRKAALRTTGRATAATHSRPTLAYVSPLPPQRTGIAAYSADLLVRLHEHYRIDLVTDQKTVDLPEALATLPIRSFEWLDAHAAEYDRTLYQIGNSPFHHRMLDMLDRHPGTVVLHDIHVGGVLNWMEQYAIAPGIFSRWLFESHGYPALIADRDRGRDATIDEYPCTFPLIERANGVVVHSAHAFELAASWFRAESCEWRQIPQLRRLPDLGRRAAARSAFGFAPGEVVFCSFGFIDATKLNHRIIDAWLASPLARDPRCVLVFVGENQGGEYGRALLRKLERSSARVRITGYVDTPTFDDYLLAADVAIQLRGVTRGETSRTVLDSLAYGLPLICNASASIREFPDDVMLRLPAEFADAELADALVRVERDPEIRRLLATNARRYVGERHDPGTVAAQLRDVIEHFAREGPQTGYRALVRSVAGTETTIVPESADWRAAAQSIAVNMLRPATRQILVDVSVLVNQDLRTGIERVVRAVLRELLERSPQGWRVEPVMARDGGYRYARRFSCEWLGVAGAAADGAPVDLASGDIFLGLDWAAHLVPDMELVLQRYRALGVTVTFVVYDLLPVLRPDLYPSAISPMHTAWLHTLSRVADGILCISNAVADELSAWLDRHASPRTPAPGIAVLPLGADIEHSVPSAGLPAKATQILDEMGARPVVLMVGTVEPRKGHAQALAAFEALWREGVQLNLVIVGRQGWMVDELASRLRGHRHLGDRLFWFESASDELLDAIYRKADVLLAASIGEGYGLPLIEAARYRVPLIARDLPVFREVARSHAMYFVGLEPSDIARAVAAWQQAREDGNVPDSGLVEQKNWRECVDELLSIVLEGRWERRIARAEPRQEGPAELTVRQIDFSQAWLPPSVHSLKGLSTREPWGRWSDADVHSHVEIRFRNPLPASGTLEIVARAFGPNAGQPVRVGIGGQELEMEFEAGDTTATVSYAVQQGPRSLVIVPPHPTAPRQLGASQDPRRIGIGLVRLTVRSAADSETAPGWTGSRIARLIEAEIGRRSSNAITYAHGTRTAARGASKSIVTRKPGIDTTGAQPHDAAHRWWYRTPVIGPVMTWMKALTRLPESLQRLQMMEQSAAEEHEQNEQSARSAAAALHEGLETVHRQIARSLDSMRGSSRERMDEYARLNELHNEMLGTVERLERDVRAVGERASDAKSTLDRLLPPPLTDTLEIRGNPIVEPARQRCAIPSTMPTPTLSAHERYALFEAAFYDSAIVANKQRIYIRYFNRELARHGPFLDLGCGRGEFLHILRSEGIASVGVDSNPIALAPLQADGFDVVLRDLVEFLETDRRTYCGAAALQVAEHLTHEQLERMLLLVAKRLIPGAPLIIETPNPLSPFALARFHTDPTHVVPLPPERLRFAVEAAGFERSLTLFQARSPGDPFSGPDPLAYYMDYAVIGYRGAS